MDTYALEIFVGTIIPSILIPCFCVMCCVFPLMCCCKIMCKSSKDKNTDNDKDKFKYKEFKISDRKINDRLNVSDKTVKEKPKANTQNNDIGLMNSELRKIIYDHQPETENINDQTENDGLEEGINNPEEPANDNTKTSNGKSNTSKKDNITSQKYDIAYLFDINEATTTKQVTMFVNIILSQNTLPKLVIIRINSPGGSVTHYGLMYSELMRIKNAKIRLVVCIDEMAASGGYLIACCADEIVSSEFATIGSIGVFMQAMNIAKIADKVGVKMEFFSAGEHKVPYNPFEETTPESKAYLEEKAASTHTQFKNVIQKHRMGIDIERVANGDTWCGIDAKDLGLVDTISTSNEYLFKISNKFKIIQFTNDVSDNSKLSGIIEKFVQNMVPTFMKFFTRTTHRTIENIALQC